MNDKYIAMGMPKASGGQISPAVSCVGGVFVPVQGSAEMWPPEQALPLGTVFPCLYSPYEKGENHDG